MGREGIDQDTGLEANAPVQLIRSNIIAVTGRQHLLLATDLQLKFTAGYVGCLAVEMLVHIAHSTLLKFHFDDHQLAVIAHNLAYYALTGRLPLQFLLRSSHEAKGTGRASRNKKH